MSTIFLALIPLLMIIGAMTWLLSMGARDQSRSDAWAAEWMRQQTASPAVARSH